MYTELYNESLLLNAKGAINKGVICHFNSLIQSILSCTSVVNFLIKNEHKENVKVITKLIDILKMQVCDKYINTYPLLSVLSSDNYGKRQEDASEGFLLLTDNKLNKYFRHTYKINTYCSNCRRVVCSNTNIEQFITIPPLEKKRNGNIEYLYNEHSQELIGKDTSLSPLNRYITQTKVLTDRKCPSCKNKSCVDIYQLETLSEVLVLLFKKYSKKNIIEFPPVMTFKTKTGNIYYKLVSQIEHKGWRNSGHYYTTCLRKEGYMNIDDLNIRPSVPRATPNTYMVFYHIFNPKKITAEA